MRFANSVKHVALLILIVLLAVNGRAQCALSLGTFTANIAHPVQFTASGSVFTLYTWSFGDGSPDTVTGTAAAQHLYADTGTYEVCIYGYDSNTLCHDTVCQAIDFSCDLAGIIVYQVNPVNNLVTLGVNSIGDGGYIAGDWVVNTIGGVNVYNEPGPAYSISTTLGQGTYIAQVIVASYTGTCVDTVVSDTFVVTGSSVLCRVLQQGTPQGIDSYIRSDLPNVNFGLSPDIVTQQWLYNEVTNSESRGLIKFDLSAIPSGSIIASASLTLFADSTSANSGNGYPGEPTYGQNNASVLQRITSPWQQLDVTWNDRPNTTDSTVVTVPQSTDNAENYTLDITAFAQLWLQYPDSNFGMMLSMPNSSAFNNLIFCSSAHPDSALRPALSICFIPPLNACNASFAYSNIGDSVHFYNQSIGGDTVKWNFDDGDSSLQADPVHYFSLNGIHQTTLTVMDSGSTCSSVTAVNVNGIIDDTLCGVVFFDANSDNLYDAGDQAIAGIQVMIDGISHLTSDSGFYHIPVGGGGHIISVVLPEPFMYAQTYPKAPSNYAISTTNNDYICGLDFAMGNGEGTGVKPVYAEPIVSVFPNPTSDYLIFSINKISTETNIVIYDLYGQSISKAVITKGMQVSIDVSQWADGLYVWKAVQGGSEVGVGKFIKE